MSYTKGPWKIKRKGMLDWRILCESNVPGCPGTVARVGFKPNARLIAAAPELLEMLKESRKAIDSLPIDSLGKGFYTEANGEQVAYPLRNELIDNINKVVAKAEKK